METITTETFKEKTDKFRRLLDEADDILIGAGSGLSVDAGIDYFNVDTFAERYPAMVRQGYTTNAELVGADPSGHNGLFWGYYLSHGYHMRFHGDVQPVYQYLLDLVGRKNYFIITTNVDALFLRNGFSPDRIYTPQGDYGRIQCQTPCSEQTWSSEPVIRGLLPLIDPVTGELPEEHIPVCPNCGGPVFFNLRGGGWFVDSPYQDQQEAYTYWLDKARNKKLLLMDIGTGFHTPVWIRWPFERLTAGTPDSSLVRINRDDARVPMSIEQRALSFQHGAMDVLKATINTKI